MGGRQVGIVEQLWRYPVKSMQGERVDRLALEADGFAGDRGWAVLVGEHRLCSAKRMPALLEASAEALPGGGVGVTLPDGTRLEGGATGTDEALSSWLGRAVRLRPRQPGRQVAYEMTFDPPHDDAEVVEIPAPPGTFQDLAAAHLVSRATLDGASAAHPELDWDVRRFRPNVLVGADVEPFGEDRWCGGVLELGTAALRAAQPTVRCAVPLRAQPGLARQVPLYRALEELHANHLGIYLDAARPGEVEVGDPVLLVGPA